jgi:hypothetical protein
MAAPVRNILYTPPYVVRTVDKQYTSRDQEMHNFLPQIFTARRNTGQPDMFQSTMDHNQGSSNIA